jgi:RimJ/RimL family protein N-acetyltransferase
MSGVTTHLADLTWPRRTERLSLRLATAADLPAIWAIRVKPGVSDWLTTAADDRDAFVAYYGDPSRLAKTIVIELDRAIIGDTMLAVQDGWAQTEVKALAAATEAELGWVVDPAYQGRGYATEVVNELIRMCFDDLGLRRVVAGCFAANEGSWRLMERVGMIREAAGRQDGLHRSGAWMDGLFYTLLAEDWRAR